mmetsp:Transcript_19021/g.28706  ORF Transcript_19021/g.28706 Transcript_19021/m.28706 type:complete len:83 (+) Transcript_19021:217-465(+)
MPDVPNAWHQYIFFAIFPPTFHIGGDDSICQKLSDKYLPIMHTNYENRSRDYEDSLPKYQTFPPNNRVNNDGSLIRCDEIAR